jgi:hypothetical protein
MDQTGSPRIVGTTEPRKYMRLPRAGARDPLFGFSRSYLNTLILPCKENDYSPPVASFVLKRRKTSRAGVRLIDLASLEAYISQHPQPKVDGQGTTEPRPA